ncbi:MAG: AAA family ATPase [Alphaproteobacteria bacterium]
MVTRDAVQDQVIEFLTDPRTHGAPVERIDTHCSIVFLAGERALKLKRAIRLPYLDYSTLALRRALCEAEVALNRRTAPTLYLGTVAVTRAPDGRLALDGPGVPVEYLVDMRRFPDQALFEALARAGRLDSALVEDAARATARLHTCAEIHRDHGGHAALSWLLDANAEAFAPAIPEVFSREDVAGLGRAQRAELARQSVLLDARREEGHVRRCHGDLHLRNIVLLDGRATPFDGIEFDDRLACIDVLYDLAFLLMDLAHRGLDRLANAAFNAYLEETDEAGGLALLPLFLSLRARVRAHVGAPSASLAPNACEAERQRAAARAYLDHARACLGPAPAMLVAVGGLSGTGKTTLARAIAPAIGSSPGALLLRSDLLRKRLMGVQPLERLPASAYGPETARRVYAEIGERAASALGANRSVIADAVFAKPEERDAIAAIAARAGVKFQAIWLEAPLALRGLRLDRRLNDASDATADIARAQDSYDIGAMDWPRIAATSEPDAVADAAARLLGLSIK